MSKEENTETIERVNNHPNEPEEQKPIRKQLQFYFSNSNYPRDKFLLEKAGENDGWIPAEVFLKFNKLQSMTEDLAVIVAAAKESRYLEVNEEGTMIKRIAPLPEVDDFDQRNVHVGGLNPRPHPSLSFLRKIFHDHGKVLSVWNVRSRVKGKREMFLEFETLEQAKAVAALENVSYVDKFTGNTVTLTTMSKEDYQKLPEPEPAKRKSEQIEEPELVLKTCVKIPGFKSLYDEETKFKEFCDSIKAELADVGTVKFVDVNPEGYAVLRFSEPGPAEALVEKMKEGREILGKKFEDTVMMTEEEETTYKKAMLSKPQRNKKSFRGRGRRGRN